MNRLESALQDLSIGLLTIEYVHDNDSSSDKIGRSTSLLPACKVKEGYDIVTGEWEMRERAPVGW